jgi:hypothetical protein
VFDSPISTHETLDEYGKQALDYADCAKSKTTMHSGEGVIDNSLIENEACRAQDPVLHDIELEVE